MATKKSKNKTVALFAGAISGGIECTVTWPSEFVKTALQLDDVRNPKYTGAYDCLRKTIKTNGVFGLYRGLGVIVAGSLPKAGIRFGAFETYRGLLSDEQGKMTAGRNFTAGLLAGVTEAILIVTPLETLKVKLMELNKGFIRGTIHVLKTEGIGGAYKGLPATMGKCASNQSVRFLAYTEYSKFIQRRSGGEEGRGGRALTPIEALVGGMTAGALSVLANNPIDSVKTRIQGIGGDTKYSGTLDCVRKMVANEGIGSFYKGTLARLSRVVPGQGVVFMSYEFVTRELEKIFGV